MATPLVILGLLRERPLYGYELKHIIEEHMGDWTHIAFGSIYYALGKLARSGFVEQDSVEQEGARPARTVYRITEAGHEEFLRLLREAWGEFEPQYFSIDVALAFVDVLPAAEVMTYLSERVAILENILKDLIAHEQAQLARSDIPALARAIFRHSRLHLETELAWTRNVLTQVAEEA